MSDRTIADHHASRESGQGCPDMGGGPHYFAYVDDSVEHRICIDCGAPETPETTGESK